MTKRTLILSNLTGDSHVPRLVAEFDRLGHPWVIFDPGDFPQKVQISASISNESRHSYLMFTDGSRICLEEISSVWYRRPTRILPRDDLPDMERTFIQREAHAGIWGWLRGLQAFWVNHPDAVRAAGHKPEQLQRAAMLPLLMLTRSYSLSYAAIDLIFTPEDRYVFLELNALGQFGWLEGRTGIPLYHMLATLLIEGAHS